MNEAKLKNLDRAVVWSIVSVCLAPLVPYALVTLIG